MKDQTRGLRKVLAPHAEFVFMNGPFEARGPSDDIIEKRYADSKPFYEWGSFKERERPHQLDAETQEMEYLDGGWYHDYVDWDTTIKYMDEQLPKLGPFDAVVGFSQDGTKKLVPMPSIHIVGKTDKWRSGCYEMVNMYEDQPEGATRDKFVFEHDTGHRFPSGERHEQLYEDVAKIIRSHCGSQSANEWIA
ncbi:hypothetical protein PInf_025414 [Phytophthora infestans]|nr:hypothetical protein PInf_025414 [Phytophthora infestans]